MFSKFFEYEEPELNYKMIENSFYISDFDTLDFQRVCKIEYRYRSEIAHERYNIEWMYSDIDSKIMFDEHSSWVYAITSNRVVKKIGECGVPLGIRNSKNNQPLKSTSNRLGRYSYFYDKNDTDTNIRRALYEDFKNGNLLEIYAYKCPIVSIPLKIKDQKYICKSKIQKDLEKNLLDYIVHTSGKLPDLNIARC
ncbi:MAG: hypothetical protein EBU90_07820 [Proteobacteria bacterium]|nr:hypothetical protein [Pseudomonadota bacterium]NBP14106.1 hypothetical protein [bacterium]